MTTAAFLRSLAVCGVLGLPAVAVAQPHPGPPPQQHQAPQQRQAPPQQRQAPPQQRQEPPQRRQAPPQQRFAPPPQQQRQAPPPQQQRQAPPQAGWPRDHRQQPEQHRPPPAQPQRHVEQPRPVEQQRHVEQQHQQRAGQPSPQPRAVWQEHRARNWQSEHRDWRARGGYNGYRIPEHRYHEAFGPDHFFRLHAYPTRVYGGHLRFQYGGFWFGFVDPWPEYWSDDWYDSDDVYVEYSEDGYYLYNRRYPRDRIAISVYVN